MFKDLNPRMQAFGCIGREDCRLSLCNDASMIDFFIDVVHGAAGHFFARRESLLPRFQPRELGQKRWVNVDEAAGKRVEHRFVQDTHETGKDNKFDACITQHFDELVFCFGFERVRNLPGGRKAFGTPNSRAISRIGASSTSDTRRRASAASLPDRMPSRIARALLPLPDPRIPIGSGFI